jgi:hypothetical protein
MDKYELREHLAQDWNAISADDLKIWGEGRGRELLARRAACRGIVLQGVEHSPVLCDLYGQIFEGVDIENLDDLRPSDSSNDCKERDKCRACWRSI